MSVMAIDPAVPALTVGYVIAVTAFLYWWIRRPR